MKIFSSIVISALIVLPCFSQKIEKPVTPPIHKIVVQQVLQTSGYTYLKVKEDTTINWIAIPKMEAKPGDIYYTAGGIEMRDFPSKELNRTFPLVYFMDYVSKTPEGAIKKEDAPAKTQANKSLSMPDHGATKAKLTRKKVIPEPIPGGTTIRELYKNKAQFNGKIVKLRGQVVKYNEHIMGKNWIHLQDGTANDEEYDLVITTNDTVELGSYISIKGKISLNKDFGSGYSFPIMMEDASLIK